VKPPIPNSYWVEPGLILAGEHPDGGTEEATHARVAALVEAGVRSFIDLTEAHELPDYRPLLPPRIAYENFPIPDHSVPRSRQQMREVQSALERLTATHAAVYVHCRAGIGRTGVTIGCYLREQGELATAALAELNRLWQQNARAARWPTVPETPEQEQFIVAWTPHPLDHPDGRDSGLHRLQLKPLDRYRGCLTGLASADVAATSGGEIPAPMASAWSDDTGTTLCVLESLLARGRFDGRDQLERYRAWAKDPGAAGARADAALRPSVREVLARAVWNKAAVLGSHDPAQQDASLLPRCAAAAMFAASDRHAAVSLGADVARVTHQAPAPVDACRLFTAMIVTALQGASRETVLKAASQFDGKSLREELRYLAADWSAPQVGRRRPPPAILGALDRAVRAFARSRGFADGLERALSAPTDRDAVAASYGALAGAYYGEAAIPLALRTRVSGLSGLENLAGQIFQRPGAADGQLA
jgi:ADP-ribosylglycohydrolase